MQAMPPSTCPSGTTPQEFSGWGAGLYVEPALKVTFPDGNRDLVLHYLSHKIDGDSLTIRLKDVERDVFVDLRYRDGLGNRHPRAVGDH